VKKGYKFPFGIGGKKPDVGVDIDMKLKTTNVKGDADVDSSYSL